MRILVRSSSKMAGFFVFEFNHIIEGNKLNEFEVKKVLDGKVVNASFRDIHEVKNYKKALDYIGKIKSATITEKNILKEVPHH